MKLDGWNIHVEKRHVLNYQGVCSGLPQLAHHAAHVRQLVLIYYSIESHIHACTEHMRPLGHTPYVVD